MSTSTYDDAKRCSRCKEAGEDGKLTEAPRSAKLPRGTKILEVWCRNSRCKWYNTMWIVQINPDGTIPAPVDHTKKEKLYVGFEGHDERARELIEQLKKNAKSETLPNTELGGGNLR